MPLGDSITEGDGGISMDDDSLIGDLCTVISPEITCNYIIYMVIYLILTT
jgi:hypothetical protein